jgi:plastocyanin
VRRRLFILALLAGGAVAVLPARAADQTVNATLSNEFTPASVTVNQGEKVTWQNTGGRHNVKFDDGSFEQPPEPSVASWTVSRSFNQPGTFRYYCELHGGPGGSGMSGTVTVLSAGGAPPPSPTLPRIRVTLGVSDSTPRRGQRVRFSGSARPQHDGRLVYIQKRTRRGTYRTIARTRLRDAGASRSRYSRRLRIFRGGVFRARVLGDGDHRTGTSRTRRLVVH